MELYDVIFKGDAIYDMVFFSTKTALEYPTLTDLKNNDIDSIITNSEIQQEDFNLETERILTPKENNEESTIELINYHDRICWSNNNRI